LGRGVKEIRGKSGGTIPEKKECDFLLKGFIKWQDFQEHLPAGRQVTRSNGLGHPADCISAGNGFRIYRQRRDSALKSSISIHQSSISSCLCVFVAKIRSIDSMTKNP